MARNPSKQSKKVETLKHEEAKRKNIPTAEYQSVMAEEEQSPVRVAYERRNRDLDPQLVWRGKDEQDWSDLVVSAPPLYIQEKVHPKVLVDDLLRQSQARAEATQPQQLGLDLFADFNGLPQDATGTDFYQHDANWTNRMILGDSLQVMASLAEREGLRGKVQCIYIDPPYGIKFNSNFQWSTTSRDVKDGNKDQITREPEQVKAFRDTWRDGIHSYLTYLRDRLVVARDLLTDSGSIFVQIGDENVHRVRALMDEVFGDGNLVALITIAKTSSATSEHLAGIADYVLFYARNIELLKYRQVFRTKEAGGEGGEAYRFFQTEEGIRISAKEADSTSITNGKCFRLSDLRSPRPPGSFPVKFHGKDFTPKRGYWKTGELGFGRLIHADRVSASALTLNYVRFIDDYPAFQINNIWSDLSSSLGADKVYVVQTSVGIVQRCLLMSTDPGDLVLDPTCGSGTTAYVAEQWGRRWITIDTSRVALALARARIMGARYPYYLLADSKAGQQKEAEITRTAPVTTPTYSNIRQGFVYERVPHITLKSIANNAEIDTIWDTYQTKLEPHRTALNAELGKTWEEWEIPRETESKWSDKAKQLHRDWWQQRIARQKEIDASIAAKADQEYLYDKPYPDNSIARVAGPFTVESLSPHRVLVVNEQDELVDPSQPKTPEHTTDAADFANVILENLKTAGVQQAHKEGKLNFTAIVGWPGAYICAEGRYVEGESEKEKRAGIFIGPEFGTVTRPDLVAAAREAGDAGFDVLIACAFNYDAHSADFSKLGRIPVLKARMNADLHMADALKNTGAGNLFVIFGEPDIDINEVEGGQIQVKIHGVDVFHPQSGDVRSSNADEIACWFIDTDYNEESFFVRHAYFLGASDPYKALKTTLKAEIDEEAWESLYSDISRPFDKPQSGRIAVKVINHLGDEVMKVFSVA
ncbi:site-specific DNA-methyltransferase [Stenomitos frigidus]|uniref:Site-specific DNA-methyltransferase n=1 Tax=Stenomitos frigidus ULC18 TaxID=2107698 RepID=A0A2T1E4N6_9CYAN|nr:site-specific DNA-methyltransferase [Stenomitos frigidus]PSB27675.1 site-specific DNA-methyltransferase [Stenomitos frigidus ULC18]